MAPDRKSNIELQEHMLWSYYGLRVGLAVIALALPFVLWSVGSSLHEVRLAPSISDYYHAKGRLPFFTTRDFFVGGLFAAGACLYFYKGFSTKENVALNLAGVFAVLVAILPATAPGSTSGPISYMHNTSAVLFFACIAYVSLVRSRDTLSLLSPAKGKRYAQAYIGTGVAMILSPVAAVALSFVIDPHTSTVIFWVETLGVVTFALYWIVKTFEMRDSDAERRTLEARLKREEVMLAPSGEVETSQHGKVVVPDAIPLEARRKLRKAERIVPAQ